MGFKTLRNFLLLASALLGLVWVVPSRGDAKASAEISSKFDRIAQSVEPTEEIEPLEDPRDGTPEAPISAPLYQPVGAWVGRLLLAPEDETGKDWVWFEVYEAPPEAQNLVGQTVPLTWSDEPLIQAYLKLVTTDIYLNPDTRARVNRGILHPFRLDRRHDVGPLQSLAGSRPEDDVVVKLHRVTVISSDGSNPANEAPSTLKIAAEPVQVAGQIYALVKIIGSDVREPQEVEAAPKPLCPGEAPCPSEFYRVRHYNKTTGKFDGPEEVIRIPQVPPDPQGVFRSTPRQLEASPAGNQGWYIYGKKDAKGTFVVQALEPRSLFQLTPDEVILGVDPGLNYIKNDNWRNTEALKGNLKTVLVDPEASSAQDAVSRWQEGDRSLVLHLIGGVGGEEGPGALFGLVNGHFSFGLGRVVRDPFTDELRFSIEYRQVYTHNTNGILSGSLDWSAFMGDLQRGWLGNRPMSDLLVKLDTIVEDYNFGGVTLSPLTELMNQLTVITSRYRTGDGTGNSTVTPATSCVQDSNQALYITIERLKQQVRTSPQIQAWLDANPNDPQTLRFRRLVTLGSALEKQLAPTGMVRPDWKTNAEILTGILRDRGFTREPWSFSETVLSWRTVLPRRAHDELGSLFLENGAQLWFLRTNQVGGVDEGILPLAPVLILD